MTFTGMSRTTKVLWAIVGLWFGLGCATSSKTTTATSAPVVEASSGSLDPTVPGAPPTTGDVVPAPSTVGMKQTEPAPIGTTVVPAKDWSVTVVSAMLNGNALAASYNQFNTPNQGKQFVLVTVKVKNAGKEPSTLSTNVQLSILPKSGVASRSAFGCLAGAPDELDTFAQLQPGAEITGTICFDVAVADVTPALVLLAEPTFTMDKGEDQRFLAIQ